MEVAKPLDTRLTSHDIIILQIHCEGCACIMSSMDMLHEHTVYPWVAKGY